MATHPRSSAPRRPLSMSLTHETFVPQNMLTFFLLGALFIATLIGISRVCCPFGNSEDLPFVIMTLPQLNVLLWIAILVLFVSFMCRAGWNAIILARRFVVQEHAPQQFAIGAFFLYFSGLFLFLSPNYVLIPRMGRLVYRFVGEVWMTSRKELPGYLAWWGELAMWRMFLAPIGGIRALSGTGTPVITYLEVSVDILFSIVSAALILVLHRDQRKHFQLNSIAFVSSGGVGRSRRAQGGE